MAVVRLNELRQMDAEMLKSRLAELGNELRIEKGHVASGGKASNPGRIKEMRRSIARILTVLNEKKIKV